MIMNNIIPHRMQEPTFRIEKPCVGCKGMTRLTPISLACDACGGEGERENDFEPWSDRLIICYVCSGTGYIEHYMRYCCQECFECSNELDFIL
jgi:hypothetical protein